MNNLLKFRTLEDSGSFLFTRDISSQINRNGSSNQNSTPNQIRHANNQTYQYLFFIKWCGTFFDHISNVPWKNFKKWTIKNETTLYKAFSQISITFGICDKVLHSFCLQRKACSQAAQLLFTSKATQLETHFDLPRSTWQSLPKFFGKIWHEWGR